MPLDGMEWSTEFEGAAPSRLVVVMMQRSRGTMEIGGGGLLKEEALDQLLEGLESGIGCLTTCPSM